MSSGPKPGPRRSMSGVRRRPRRPQPADPRLRSRSARQLARSLLAPPQSSRVRRWSPTRSALAIAASAGFTGAILARNPSSLGNQDHAAQFSARPVRRPAALGAGIDHYWDDAALLLQPSSPKPCGALAFGSPTILRTIRLQIHSRRLVPGPSRKHTHGFTPHAGQLTLGGPFWGPPMRGRAISAVVLPFGTEPETHAWLHAACWPAWHQARGPMPLRRCERWAFRHENLVMSAKNPIGDKATTVVADDWEETLKRVGGSQSDDWNHVLGNQALQSLSVEHSDMEVRQRQSFGLEVPTGEESGS
jgi:hypothetical protein